MDLIYKETKEKNSSICKIEIGLRSLENNRKYEFSIGGDYKDENGYNVYGCIHDIIEEFFPEYRIFLPLHLCDSHGAPLYAIENGMYHIKRLNTEEFCKLYRVRADEHIKLKQAAEDNDELYFRYLLYELGIEDRWRKEADRAISVLENITGQKFVDMYKTYSLTQLTEKTKKEMKEKVTDGYYSPERIRERVEERKKAFLHKCEKNARHEYNKVMEECEEILKVKLYVISMGLSTDSLYYHSNTKEAKFYEKYSLHEEYRVTKEQFDEFMKNIDYSKLPEGIVFKYEE